MHPFSQKSKTVWRVRIGCLMLAGAFLCGIAAAFSFQLAIVLGILFAVLGLVSSLWYCPRRQQTSRWGITQNQAILEIGVFFRITRILPLERLQYAELLRTPAQRWCGTCTLILHAAGAKLSLPQLDWVQGEKLYLNLNGGAVQ